MMWGASEEPPGTMEGGPPESVADLKETCKQSKSQLETLKEIMIRNKESLRKKEEEAQEYAKKLSKFKSRAKYSRRSKDGAASSGEAVAKSSETSVENIEETVDDISQAKTPKAKSSLLQKKLMEDRKMFEQRSKEITKSKRAVEEKVEALRQQLDEKSAAVLESQVYQSSVLPLSSLIVNSQAVSSTMQMSHLQDKDNKIAELSNRVVELEALVLDLQENLREKDSVIDSKTKAVTLMSADLSRKGKTTLDTLEDTKDEMRTMQENFILLETSLRNKNSSLLDQLRERDETIEKLEQHIETQKLAESANVDFSRSTMDTLADAKDAMRSMQENFVLVESSLKAKNDNLLKQLEEREVKLAEAEEKVRQFEAGAGIVKDPSTDELRQKIEMLERSNHLLQDEKYELQKSIAELQNKVVTGESVYTNGLIVEKENRIAELESLIEELKKSNQLLEEESTVELQGQVADLTARNEEFTSKINELEKLVHYLETEKREMAKKSGEGASPKKEDAVAKLTKELEELNKSMIKLKAQHKNKMKNLQRQLESFRKVSDTNAELVKLGNQVALLEEEKGNLQLSLVDFDELKASMGDWKEQIADLEGKVSAQAKENETHIEAIATLENQKLDLTQELLAVKQEISTLEAENAESENLRVIAEMKIVDLEEQLEALNKLQCDTKEGESLKKRIEILSQENTELLHKLAKLEEKGSSDTGSTESFETLQETDRNELLKKIESLIQRNTDLEHKLSKHEEKPLSTVDSTDSFEAISDVDKNDLLKRIDLLTRTNNDLLLKLNRFEEKGSSDSGSTESFERIPEQGESMSKIELLTRENNELVIKLTKLEERLSDFNTFAPCSTELVPTLENRIQNLISENNDIVIELEKLREKTLSYNEEKDSLQNEITTLLEEKVQLVARIENLGKASSENVAIESLEREINEYKKLIAEQKESIEEMKMKLAEKEEELARKFEEIAIHESSGIEISILQQELKENSSVIEEWKYKCSEMQEKIQLLESGKESIEDGFRALQEENKNLLEESEQKSAQLNSLKLELSSAIDLLSSKDQELATLQGTLDDKDKELHDKYLRLQNEMITIDSLQEELNEQKNLIASLMDEIQKLRLKNDEKEVFLTKNLEEYDELLNCLSKKDVLVNQLQNNIDEYKNEIEQMKTYKDSLLANYTELQASLDVKEEEYFNLLQSNQRLEEMVKDLKSILESSDKSTSDLKVELRDVYDIMEKLKIKHVEDVEMQNRRLEDVLEDLQNKMLENDTLKLDLKSKETLTSEIGELEKRLEESKEDVEAKLEKMKKFAVKLKKKTAQCEELESRLVELEQKWTSEKDEKEATNNRIQEVEAMLREKDNRILDLEEQLQYAQSEWEEASKSLVKFNAVLQSVTEMGEESIDAFIEKSKRQQVEMDEAKEAARELNVRMQVMEVEYVEHLSLINTLQAENGMLSSKQAQINEKLENAEKESEERRVLLETMEKEREVKCTVDSETQTAQTSEANLTEGGDSDISVSHCEHCERSHEMVRQLETRLQERDTEIENLDNELANSIGNFVQMQENLRFNNMMNQSTERNTNLREAYNDLTLQYNVLTTANEEMKEKLSETLRENEDMTEKVSSLQQLNAILQERINAVEQELTSGRETTSSLENVNTLYAELIEKFSAQTNELDIAQQGFEQLKTEKIELLRIKEVLEREIVLLKENLVKLESSRKESSEDSILPDKHVEDTPPLFDAFKAFDASPISDTANQFEMERLRNQIIERESQCSKLSVELSKLSDQISEERVLAQQAQVHLANEIADLRTKLGTVTAECNNLSIQLQKQLSPLCGAEMEQIATLNNTIFAKDQDIESLKLNLASVMEDLTNLKLKNSSILESKDVLITKLESEKFNYESQLQTLLLEKEDIEIKSNALSIEKEGLLDSQEAYKADILQLENKVKELSDTSRVEELESRIGECLRERDLFQLQINDLHLTLDSAKEESASFTNSFRELQNELDKIRREKNDLEIELKNLTEAFHVKEQELLQKTTSECVHEPMVQKVKISTAEQGWDDGNVEKLDIEEEGWGWNTEDAQLSEDQIQATESDKSSSLEVELRTKILGLEEMIQNLETEKLTLLDNNKAIQAKCDKAVKKLMQKIKQEKLQQMQQQKSSSSLCDLDQTIEEELKFQIVALEKALSEAKEEQKKITAERDNLLNRVDVLLAANERYVEMKERQDMDVEVYEIRNKELMNKIQTLELQLQEISSSPLPIKDQINSTIVSEISSQTTSEISVLEDQIQKYKEEIDDLKENMDALAAENEQLQDLLADHRSTRLELEAKLAADAATCVDRVDESAKKYIELTESYEKLKEEYDLLRKQYEHSLMDANDQVQVMRESNELLKSELFEKASEHESEINILRQNANSEISKLSDQFRDAIQEKNDLFQKINNLTHVEEKFTSASVSLIEVTELLNLRVQEVASLKEELQQQCNDRLRQEENLQETIQKLLQDKQQQIDKINEKERELYQQNEITQRLFQAQEKEMQELTAQLKEVESAKTEYAMELNMKNADIKKHLQELKHLKDIVNEKESIFSACQADSVSKEQVLEQQQSRISQCELELQKYAEEVEKYSIEVHRLKDLLYEEATRRSTLIEEGLGLKIDLTEKKLNLERCDSDHERCKNDLEEGSSEIQRLREIMRRDQLEIERLSEVTRNESERFSVLIANLSEKDRLLLEKDVAIQESNQTLSEKQMEIEKLKESLSEQNKYDPLDSIPVFTMSSNDDTEMINLVDKLKGEVIAKQVEIDNLTFALNKNTYPKILQDLQDTINKLYNDKAELEMSLENSREEIERLKHKLNSQVEDSQVRVKEDIKLQEEIVKLQNELHLKDQEINELRYVIGEKDAKLQASLEPSTDDLETIQTLNSQLYVKHQETESLKALISELQVEIANLKHLEKLSKEDRSAIERLTSEKEFVRQEAEEYLQKSLMEKENEIHEIKTRMLAERDQILEALQIKDKDIENLQFRMQEQVHMQNVEISNVKDELAEKDRRLAELSITKDEEIHNLKVQIHEKEVRIEELLAFSEDEDKQLTEIKQLLEKKEKELGDLKTQLEDKLQELELVQTALNRHAPIVEEQKLENEQASSSELDLALYMLHQRDVRCEELTQELMQLLEERDTLQLRLSNAIRVNEELRKFADSGPEKDIQSSEHALFIDNPSPSKSEGPVEIAKEAIHAPIGEDQNALVENEGRTESIKRPTELAVGEKYTEGSPHVIEDQQL